MSEDIIYIKDEDTNKPFKKISPLKTVQGRAYLRSKEVDGVDATQMTINAYIPQELQGGGFRHLPNDIARTALFSARNKTKIREVYFDHLLFNLTLHISIKYYGQELRAADDEIVWMQLLHYAQRLPVNTYFEFELGDLLDDIGWGKDGRSYDRARACLKRLATASLEIDNTKVKGASGYFSFLNVPNILNDDEGKRTRYCVSIPEEMIIMFVGHGSSAHRWIPYRYLSAIARRLADYIASHEYPHPLSILDFHKLCNSDSNPKNWRESVVKAAAELVDAGIAESILVLDGWIKITKPATKKLPPSINQK